MLHIFFAPQPDEKVDSSAAYEYAKRASDLLLSNNAIQHDKPSIDRLSTESLSFMRNEYHEVDTNDLASLNSSSSILILISCSADGSVDRIVRKLIRSMKNSSIRSPSVGEKNSTSESVDESSLIEPKRNVAIALLGHARCDNSANQMKDTIFNHGRKFHKSVELQSDGTKISMGKLLEVQVELEGPDTPGGFNEWVHASRNKIHQSIINLIYRVYGSMIYDLSPFKLIIMRACC